MSVAGKIAEAKAFTISRVLDAPRDLVWQARSQREHFEKWWGPMGCKLEVRTFDFKPGGIIHYALKMPDGQTWWGRFVHREIVEPERMVFVSSFSDEKGGVARAPFNPNWPLEILNTMTFTEAGGKTTLAIHAVPLDAIEDEQAAFEGMFDSMRQGFGGTLNQLESYLKGL